ncbi:MAG: FtsQ-type POTRA domain-containing protein [Firmicutes bacterium]|nr:FtsQ-type POTRA domain-containing protein [Bacillota bacterium]
MKRARAKKTRAAPLSRKIFLLAIFVMSQVVFFNSPFFQLKSIEVYGNQKVGKEDIVQAAKVNAGDNILRISIPEINKSVKSIIWIKSVKVSRIFPGGLKIQVEERKPALVVSRDDPSMEWFDADEDGYVLEAAPPVEDEMTPHVVLQQKKKIEVGSRIDSDKIRIALDAWTELDDKLKGVLLYFEIDEDRNLTLECDINDNPLEIRLGVTKDLSSKFANLYALLDYLDKKKVQAEYIDYRFSQPYVMPKKSK